MQRLGTKMELKNFYRTLVALVIPMALQNLINVAVNAADVLMLGMVGETAISSASLAGQVYFVMTMFFLGLTSGASVLTAQYLGKGDKEKVEQILCIALRYGILIAAVFLVASAFFPEQLMQIFSNEEDVIKEGARYLRIVSAAYIPVSITMVYLNVMRSVGRVIISTAVYLVSLIVNVLLNAVFIFGMWGAPRMGTAGAALATVLARYAEFIIVMVYAFVYNKEVRIRFKNFIRVDKLLNKDFLKFALPVTFNELAWGLGTSTISAIIGHLGKEAVSADSVVATIRQLTMVITLGVANAAAIMIGRAIGEGRPENAKAYSKRFIKITILMGIIGGTFMLVMSPVVPEIMSLGAEAEGYLSLMMKIMSYFVFCQGLDTLLIVGIFRAGGDTNFGLTMDISTLWFFAIPMGAMAAFWWNLPVWAVFLFLYSDELIKIGFIIHHYLKYKWIKNVTR